MNINATLLGQAILLFSIALAALGYYLGKRKTNTPALMAFISFCTALIPPLGLLFITLLAMKKNLPKFATE